MSACSGEREQQRVAGSNGVGARTVCRGDDDYGPVVERCRGELVAEVTILRKAMQISRACGAFHGIRRVTAVPADRRLAPDSVMIAHSWSEDGHAESLRHPCDGH